MDSKSKNHRPGSSRPYLFNKQNVETMKDSKEIIEQIVRDHHLTGEFNVTFEQPFGNSKTITAKNEHGDKISVRWDENIGEYYNAKLSRELTCLTRGLTSPNFWDKSLNDELSKNND